MDCLNMEIAHHLCRRGVFKTCEVFTKVVAAHRWSVYHHSALKYILALISQDVAAILGRWNQLTRGIVGTTQRRACGLESARS